MMGEEGGWRDVMVLGECDEAVVRVCTLCGWGRELERMAGGGGGVNTTPPPPPNKCNCKNKN